MPRPCSIPPEKRAQPGECRNPNGRPKKENCFSDIARQLLASKKIDIEYTFPKNNKMITSKMHIESDNTIYHSLITALIKEGLSGNIQAIKELIDRTDGKAKESIDHTTNGKDINAKQVNFDVTKLSIQQVENVRSAIRDSVINE